MSKGSYQYHGAFAKLNCAQGQGKALVRLLQVRFGELPPELLARLDTAAVDELDRITDRVLGAATLDDIFAEPAPQTQAADHARLCLIDRLTDEKLSKVGKSQYHETREHFAKLYYEDGQRKVLDGLLRARFVAPFLARCNELLDRLKTLKGDEIDRITDRVLSAATLDDVFAEPETVTEAEAAAVTATEAHSEAVTEADSVSGR